MAPYSYITDQNMIYIDQNSIISRAWNLRGQPKILQIASEKLFFLDFQFFAWFILNENTIFYCRGKFLLIQAVCVFFISFFLSFMCFYVLTVLYWQFQLVVFMFIRTVCEGSYKVTEANVNFCD